MLVSWRVQREGSVVGWVSGLGSETVGWGFLVSGFGFAVGEGDVLEERERSERDGRWNGHGGCRVGREDSRVWEW